jgi:outer membrane protein OmpA-like peptidoglycan-associated protein
MKERATMVVEISGHTDATGSATYNKKLSEKRAKAVASYLVTQGIDEGRIKSVGYGETKPAINNDTVENRRKNRRVEFKVEKQ